MRTIALIIVHCSANRAGSALRMADIDNYLSPANVAKTAEP